MSYYDIYNKRVNRYGTDTHDRLENARRANFERFLNQSPHYVTFEYDKELVEGVLEPYRQDETKTLMHILIRAEQHLDVGTIVTIVDRQYMIYYLDERRDSGYNRYVILKMTHTINWTGQDDEEYTTNAYFYGQEDNMLKNELKSRSRSDTLYLENLKLNFLIMPLTDKLTVNTYIIITTKGIVQYFRVTGFDIVSSPGIIYVSIDPTYERDLTPLPQQKKGEPDEEFFWITGGKK